MNRSRNTSNVKIPYRDGKIVKELSLNLDNEHDARFYESYHKIPLDNRNYLASLYAREQENGVNDDVGHRLQDLALINPTEDDPAFMREKRNAELESLNESLVKYTNSINELEAKKASIGLNATDEAELTELKKKRDELKRRIRNINSSVTKAFNAKIFGTGHLSGLNSLNKTALLESLNTIAENMRKDTVAFLEDKFEKLPAGANGEDGAEQYVITNAAYLAAMCQQIGIDDVSKLSDAIKQFYILLKTITNDTLTQVIYHNRYSQSVDDIIKVMDIIDDIHVPEILNNSREEAIVEQMKPVAASIKFALGRAAYKTYKEAEERDMPNWGTIKDILDRSKFKELYTIGNEVDTYKDSMKLKQKIRPYKILHEAISNAAKRIWESWANIPSPKYTSPMKPPESFADAVYRRNNSRYIGRALYKKRDDVKALNHPTVVLTAVYEYNKGFKEHRRSANNLLSIHSIEIGGTQLTRALIGINFHPWMNPTPEKYYPDPNDEGKNDNYYYVLTRPVIDKDAFAAEVADKVLDFLEIREDDDVPLDIVGELLSRNRGASGIEHESGAAQYRPLTSAESDFHNIIDMGNPLKAIRSKSRR